MAIELATAVGIGLFGILSYIWYETIDGQLIYEWMDRKFQIGSWFKFFAQFNIYLSILIEMFYLAEESASLTEVFSALRIYLIVLFLFITLINFFGMVTRSLVIVTEDRNRGRERR